MLAIYLEINRFDWWTNFGKAYALALHEAGEKFVLYWTDRKQLYDREMVEAREPEFLPLFDHHQGHNAGAHGQIECVLYVGDVVGAVEYSENKELFGRRNIALVNWPLVKIPPNLVAGLKRYNAIVVPDENTRHVLKEAGLKDTFVIRAPLRGLLPEKTNERIKGLEDYKVFGTVGYWESLDNVKDIVSMYFESFGPKSKTLLHVVCPDFPHQDGDVAEAYEVESLTDLAPISIDRGTLDRPLQQWGATIGALDGLVSYSGRGDGTPWEKIAGACGVIRVSAGLGYWAEVSDTTGLRGVAPGDTCYRDDASELVENWKELLSPFCSAPPEEALGNIGSLKEAGDELQVLVHDVLHEDPRAEEVAVPRDRPNNDIFADYVPEASPSIAFVIPHKNLGSAALEPTVYQLKRQLGEADRIIVVDQMSDHGVLNELSEWACVEGLSLVTGRPETNATVWNMAAARNAGALAAEACGMEAVMYVDGDILLPQGYTETIRRELAAVSGLPVVPLVQDGERPVTREELEDTGIPPVHVPLRPGAGICAVSLTTWLSVGGFDDTFQGYGSEDIDFLYRVKQQTRRSHSTVTHPPYPYHQPHPDAEDKEEHVEENAQRMLTVMENAEQLENPEPPDYVLHQQMGLLRWLVRDGKRIGR
jgi:hypothetical protein